MHQGIGEILKERRKNAGLTQRQVADSAGIQIQQYQKFESGARDITNGSFRIACKVIEALGMDITEFFHEIADIAVEGKES